MPYEHQEFPKYLYHWRLARSGRVFQSEAEVQKVDGAGWVDTPAKFPRTSELTLEQIRQELDDAETEMRACVDGGALPGSERWEKANTKYTLVKNRHETLLREQELASKTRPSGNLKAKKNVFKSAFDLYKVVGQLGQGGNGVVFEVVDESGGSWAIKRLSAEAAANRKCIKRFKNEIAFCYANKHGNIITIIDWGTAEDAGKVVPFYVMPKYPSTLRKAMRDGVPHELIPVLFCQLLDGLEAAHVSVWHRDIKPENILYDPTGPRVILADFGIAHFAEEQLHTLVETSNGDRLGNYKYAAPEQRSNGVVDQRADLYSLGLVLNEMFTREIPQGTRHKTIGSVAPEYGDLDGVVDRMVRQSPSERPSSIAEVRELLAPHRVKRTIGEVVRSESSSVASQW